MSRIEINFSSFTQKLGEVDQNGNMLSKDLKITNPLTIDFTQRPNHFITCKAFSFVKDDKLKTKMCILTMYNEDLSLRYHKLATRLTISNIPPFVNGFICFGKKIEKWIAFPTWTILS